MRVRGARRRRQSHESAHPSNASTHPSHGSLPPFFVLCHLTGKTFTPLRTKRRLHSCIGNLLTWTKLHDCQNLMHKPGLLLHKAGSLPLLSCSALCLRLHFPVDLTRPPFLPFALGSVWLLPKKPLWARLLHLLRSGMHYGK